MTISELYTLLQTALEGNILTIDNDTAGGIFSPLLGASCQEQITITSCSVSRSDTQILLSGRSALPSSSSASESGSVSVVFREFPEDTSAISYVFSITLKDGMTLGSALEETCSSLLAGEPASCLFDSFVLYEPVFYYACEPENFPADWSLKGYAHCPGSDVRWEKYRYLLPERMPFSGTVCFRLPEPPLCTLEFYLQKSIPFLKNTVIPSLVMRTVRNSSFEMNFHETRAYLCCQIPFSSKTVTFYIRLFAPGEHLNASASVNPPLTIPDITGFMQMLFGTGSTSAQLLLPQDTMLSAFGLRELHLSLAPSGKNFTDGISIEHAFTLFSLTHPISLPVPGLKLDDFLLSWELSWYGHPDSLITLFAAAKASLTLGNLKLSGDMTGYFPTMNFTGCFTLEKELSLEELASAFDTALPPGWEGKSHTLASLDISASGLHRTLSVSGSVSDILTIHAGSLALTLKQLQASALVTPDQTAFSVQGTVLFQPEGYTPFSFTLCAQYGLGDWIFTGELSSGQISIGALILSFLQVQADKLCADIALEEFSVSYSTNNSSLTLYASFHAFWFQIFGITPSLGGRIKLLRDNTKTDASAAFYLDVDIFRFLVQADHFYSNTKRTFLFRLNFGDTYIQAVYQKPQDDEIIIVTLGGVTLGDMVLALIRLINPNARTSLPAPWNILNQIRLSDFSLRINVTQKTAALLYHVDLNIAGLMRIEDIGLSYSSASGVAYILTGQLLTQNYTTENPLSWNAMTEAPPAVSATDEISVRIFYLGIGNHLDLQITKETLPEILAQVRTALTPVSGFPAAGYRAESGWLFGIDMELSNLFHVQLLLYSPKLYGALLEVHASSQSPLAVFNGLLLELYYKKISDSTGMFHCRLVIPERFADLELGVLHLHLGQLLLEVYTNGSFYLDLGFPHGMDFASSFGLSFGIFGGMGGVYFASLTGDAVSHVPQTDTGVFTPVVRLGIGLTAGIMRSFDLGIVKGGVSLTLTGIFEGIFSVFHPCDTSAPETAYYCVHATAGVSGSLFLTVDFKIITISASAAVSASCDLELESCRKAELCLLLELELSASIRIVFFKIKFSFHFRHQVSFTFGSDCIAPWDNTTRLKSARHMACISTLTARTNASLKNRQISLSIALLCSAINPQEPSRKQFCEAFLTILDTDGFGTVMELLADWILSHFPDEILTVSDAQQIKQSDLPGQLTFEGLTELLSRNLTISLCFADNEAENASAKTSSDDSTDGIFFPMLPWLIFHVNDSETDFGSKKVTEDDMNAISEYFYRLSPDPSFEPPVPGSVSNSAPAELPLCGAVLTDWFQLAASELTGQLVSLYDQCPAETDELTKTASDYGVHLSEILDTNPEISLHLDRLPAFDLTVHTGDTLYQLQNTYSLETDSLWQDVRSLTTLCTDTISLSMDGYCFDNRTARLTVAQACALFYVRLCPFEPFYAPYAEYLLAHNDINEDWICTISGQPVLQIPDGTYLPSCGDTVVTISKMLCLLEKGCEDTQWSVFWNSFLEHNPSAGNHEDAILDSYNLFGSYLLSRPHNLEKLFLTCYPDLSLSGREYSSYALWNAPILRPLSVITLHNALTDTSGTAAELVQAYGLSAICNAFSDGSARLNGSQTINVRFPQKISKESLTRILLSKDTLSATGSILSRAFLQGACPPAPGTQEETPLYELLGQQLLIPEPPKEQRISITVNHTAPVSILPPAEEMILSAEKLALLLPSGELSSYGLPALTPSDSPVMRSWSLTKGSPILSSSEAETFYQLPNDCIRYIKTCQTVPELSIENAAIWCTSLNLTLRKISENVYYMWGVRADDREQLHTLSSSLISQCRLFYTPSRLDAQSSDPCELLPKTCFLVKSDLSTETHYGPMTVTAQSLETEDDRYIAPLSNPTAFLKLLWECSVIGGGFWFYMDAPLADSAFSENGTASLRLAVLPAQTALPYSALNALILNGTCGELSLTGNRESIMVPALPAGCVGLSLTLPRRDEGLENLYQILAYEAYSPGIGKNIQSAPILPRELNEGYLVYSAAVPLWKLCDTKDSFYAWVGKTFALTFFLRDVLGNSVPLGSVSITGAYNDTLHALHELPCTRWNYGFTEKNGDCLLEITGVCSPTANTASSGTLKVTSEADQAAVHTVAALLEQISCPDIILTARCSLDETIHHLTADYLGAVRQYVSCLYSFLTIEDATPPVPVVMTFPLERQSLPDDITPLNVCLTLERMNANGCAPCVRRADSTVLTWEDFEAFSSSFENVFGKIPAKLALDQSELPYYVPFHTLIGKLSILPYAITLPAGTILSPEFYAPAPLSNKRITKTCEIYDYAKNPVSKTFADADVNLWERQLLSDIETLLSGETVCRAARICPDTVQSLIGTKGQLADILCERLLPIGENAAPVPEHEIRTLLADRLKSSLNLLYDTSVIAVFRSDFARNSGVRLESYIDSPHVLSASKPDAQHETFCLFFPESSHRQTRLETSVSFPNIEYGICREGSYERSQWLRFHTPITGADWFADISLAPDTEIPIPRRECPLPPVLSSQTGTASLDAFLFWDWSVQITCQAYEQYTVYLELLLEKSPSLLRSAERTYVDVLADYCDKRTQLQNDIHNRETTEEQFADSLQIIAELAQEYAHRISPRNRKYYKQSNEKNKICMQITFTIEDTVMYTLVPDEQSQILMNELGIQTPSIQHISRQMEENTLTFQVCLPHLPVYQCRYISPSAHIVQNDNLFGRTGRKVRDEFIFRTEPVSLEPYRISIHYDMLTLSGNTLADSIHSIWQMLKADSTQLLLVLTASYRHPLSPETAAPVFTVPVTLIPDAKEATVTQALETWLQNSGFADDTTGSFVLDITVFDKNNSYPIVQTSFCIN